MMTIEHEPVLDRIVVTFLTRTKATIHEKGEKDNDENFITKVTSNVVKNMKSCEEVGKHLPFLYLDRVHQSSVVRYKLYCYTG